jgi:predicted nucleic acid-binding protein
VLLVDTNVFLAAADRRAEAHQRCAAVLREHEGEVAASVPVIAETAWLLLDRLGTASHSRFLRAVAERSIEPVDPTAADWRRCVALVDSYADLRLDLVDAATIAAAERLRLRTLATLNRRDFNVVRPTHCEAFELIP